MPLAQIAEWVGAQHGAVTDVYPARWFARNLLAIHVPLIVLGAYLHTRNLRTAEDPLSLAQKSPASVRLSSVAAALAWPHAFTPP